MTDVLECAGLRKVFMGGDGRPIEVLNGLDLAVARGEFVAVVGESGSGKSTLLHLLGALDEPTSGIVSLAGTPYATRTPADLARVRNEQIGFVFQFHHLLREFSAVENVMMPLLIGGVPDTAADTKARSLLDRVGLSERLHHRPSQLSGGEQQRVALARALARDPILLLADEPSGSLDHHNSERLHDLLAGLARDFETALVVVTHERSLAARADRILGLNDGALSPVAGVEAMP